MEETSVRRVVESVAVCGLLLIAPFSSASAAGPSFDCKKVLTAIESLICGNAHLADQDVELSRQFSKLSHASPPEVAHIIVKDQRNWVRYRNVSCSNHDPADTRACLTDAYRTRLVALDLLASAEDRGDPIIRFEGELRSASRTDPMKGPDEFNPALQTMKLDARVTSCSIMVSVGLTRYETGIGGLCTARNASGRTSHVLICDDTAVGNFKQMDEGSTPATLHDVAQFTADHCTGG